MHFRINKLKSKLGLFGAISTFGLVFFASAAPIPLYSVYRQTLLLTNADLSFSSVCYFVGTVFALLFLARLSNQFGRKPVVIVALILSILGVIEFITLNSVTGFYFARFVQGLSCGLASSAAAAYVVDLASPKLGTIAVSTTPMIGLSLGSLGSGFIVETTGSLTAIYWVAFGFAVIATMLVLLGKETIGWQKSAVKNAVISLVPNIGLPERLRHFLPAAAAVFIGTWAIGGFFQTFSAPIARDQLHSTSVLVGSTVFAAFQIPAFFGSVLSGKISQSSGQKIGMTGFFLSTIGLVLALAQSSVFAVLGIIVLASLTFGLAYAASIKSLLSSATLEERAGILSLIYIIGYAGAAVPNLIVGKLASGLNLVEITTGYAVLVGITWLIVISKSRHQ